MRRVALAAVLLAVPALAEQSKSKSKSKTNESVHAFGDVAGGACSRYDDATGTLGVCSDAVMGIDVRVIGVWRLSVALGLGFTPVRTSFAPATHVSMVGGGGHGILRFMPFSFYAERFFMNVGAELRPNALLSMLGLGVAGVVEVGVRVVEPFEIGVRFTGGGDSTRFGDARASAGGIGFATGTQLLLRVVLP